MKSSLQALGVWRVVTGERSRPGPESGDLDKFLQDFDRAAGWLKMRVETSQMAHFEGFEDDPKEIWDRLGAAHVSKKPALRFNAYAELFSITKGTEETLTGLMGRIESAMQAIRSLRPDSFTVAELDDELQAMAMIRALPAEYQAFRSSLMLLDKIDKRTLQEAFKNEEIQRQQAENVSSASPARALAASTSGAKQNTPRPRTLYNCDFCGRVGHTMDRCRQFAAAQREARWKAQGQGMTGQGMTGKTGKSAEQAAPAQEFAGNASLCSPDSLARTDMEWTADSGASAHMTPNRNYLHEYSPYCVPIRLADGNVVYSKGVGVVHFIPDVGGKDAKIVTFTRVLHVPDLDSSLLSILYLTRHCHYVVSIDSLFLYFGQNGQVKFTASIHPNNNASLNGRTQAVREQACLSATSPMDYALWHRRLAHQNMDGVTRMVRESLVTGLRLQSKSLPTGFCEPCLAGKMHANPFPLSQHRATELLELVHSDVHGPLRVRTHSGYRYWVTFIDDASRFWVVYLLKAKSEVFTAYKQFQAYAERYLGCKVKTIRDDKGGEYMSNAFLHDTLAEGVQRQHTTRNRPQQNGVAERANRTIQNGITALLQESGLPVQFWGEALAAFVHVRNRCATSTLNGTTPYTLWHKKKPDVSHLRVWGCQAYVHVQKDKRPLLGSHMEKCVFIGYPEGYKGWRFYNPTTKQTVISERAEFDEHYFPHKRQHQQHSLPRVTNTPIPEPVSEYIQVMDDEHDLDGQDHNPVAIPEVREESTGPEAHPPSPPLALRREPRLRKPPGEWWRVRPSPEPMTEENSLSGDELNLRENDEEEEVVEFAGLASGADPHNYAQAMKCPDAHLWKKACEEEYQMHLENGTWELVKLPPGRKAIGSGWVFKVKRKADGSIERYKARFVAKGYSQRPGLDYTEVFAPTSRAPAIRLILALAAIEDMHLHTVDISHAFVNGKLDEEIYMEQPQGFVQPGYVCRLNRSLYGLKQASRVWNKTLHAVFSKMGFKRSESDHGIYVFVKDDVRIFVPVWVDDITFASKSQSSINSCIQELGKQFDLRNLGPTTYLLGIEIKRDRANYTISLSQKQYILDVLERYKMSDCHPVSTPIDPGLRLEKDTSASTPEDMAAMKEIPYLSAVGALMYLAVSTRPDIAYACGVLARFSSNPGPAHWKAVKHLMRYVKGTVDVKLTYGPSSSGELFTSFSDADFGGCKKSGKSTSGYLIKVGTGAVSWRSKLQPIVALSTTEAEYIAAVEAGKEMIWMHNILSEFGYKPSLPSKLRVDNQSAMNVAKNPEHHGRMKHLDLRFHWLREKVEAGLISLSYIPTAEMPADILTKGLPRAQVEMCRHLMGLQEEM